MVNPKFKPGMRITAYLDNYLYESINNKAKAYNVRGLIWRYHPSYPGSTPIKLDSLYELRNNLEKVLNASLCDTYHSHDNIHNVDSVRDRYRCVHDYVDNADSGYDHADSIDGGYDSIDFADNFKKDHSVLSTYDQSYDADKSVTGKYHCTSYDSVDTQDSETTDHYYSDSVNSNDSVTNSNSVNSNNSDDVVYAVYNQTCILNKPSYCNVDAVDSDDNDQSDYADYGDYADYADDGDYSDYSDYDDDGDYGDYADYSDDSD